jgi:hypothetical protein
MRILIIVAVAAMGDFVLCLLMGSFLSFSSKPADAAEQQAASSSQEVSETAAPAVQGVAETRQS